MTTLVFPGQGSQYPAMVKDFFENFSVVKDVFSEIEESVGFDLKDIIFGENSSYLNQTKYTQISIFCASISIFRVLESEIDLKDLRVHNMLGHSLGEYTALTASNSLTINETSRLLKIRGELMNTAIEPNTSSMAALIGLDCSAIEKILFENKINLEIANDNSPFQIVISGMNDDIRKSEKIFLSQGVKKFVKLNVSAAFHSKIMKEAEDKFTKEIDKFNFKDPICNIISNYNASFNSDKETVLKNLKLQMANRVRWTESIRNIQKKGEKKIIEIGPGKVLSGLIKRISDNFEITSLNSMDDLKKINLL